MAYPPTVYKTWVAGETLTAADLNNSMNIIPNSNIPEDIDDFSVNEAEMQTTVDPFPAGVASLATSLSEELSRLRYVIAQITGETQWYIDPDRTIAGLATLLGTSTTQIQVPNGSAASPSIVANDDVNTGLYWNTEADSGVFVAVEGVNVWGAKSSFTQSIPQFVISATTNQLVLGTTNTVTITSPAPSASRVYTIPDAGGAASFVMTEGVQTINGVKTLGNQLVTTAGSIGTPAVLLASNCGIYKGGGSGNAFNVAISGVQKLSIDVAVAPLADILDGQGDGVSNIGGASNYFNDISYKTLTDRGCIPWCDDGVEMADGSRKSDLAALCSIEKHPTKMTVHGLPRLDYSTFPKKAWRLAESDDRFIERDKDGVPWCLGIDKERRQAEDGVEMTMMFGVMIGAFKELAGKVDALTTRIVELEK